MFRPSGTGVDAEVSPATLEGAARQWQPTWHAGARRRLRRLSDSPLVRASVQTIAAGLGAQGMLLVSGALSARMLGVDGRGALATLMLWPLIVMLLGTLGVPVACTFFLRDRPGLGAEIWAEALRMATGQSILLTAVVGGALLAFADLRQPGMAAAVGMTLLMVAPMVLHRYGLAVLQGRGRFTAYNVLRTLPNAIYTCCIMALFVGGSTSLTMVVAANLAACVLACGATMASVRRELAPRWTRVAGLRRQLLSFGLRGHLGAVAPVDGLRLDQAVVAVFLDARAMGLYVAAYAFTNLPRFIAESASRVALPTVADRGGRSEQLRLVRQFFWGVTALIVPVTTLILVAMPLLMRVCFGEAFLAAVPIARTLLVGTTFVAWRRILVEGLRGLGDPLPSTVAELSMYPWLLLVAPPLMWWAGGEGLALALSSGYALSLLVALRALGRRSGR